MVRGKRTKERTGRIEIRCTPAERQGWEAQAAAQGCSLSTLIRQSLAKRQTACVADPALVRQAAAIGNNVNQLAWWVNTHKSNADAKKIEEGLAKIRVELSRLIEKSTGGASC